MATARKRSSHGTAAPGSASRRQAVIRMYNVGFGDAFLVTLIMGGTTRRILFDCGSVEADPGTPMASIVDSILEDVTGSDGKPRIDVIVCTHRHKDHVSGFANPKWDTVEVKEVWMPWTEHPTDADARAIRNTQSKLAVSLGNWLAGRQRAALTPVERSKLDRGNEIVNNALMLSNDKAMKMLHNGFEGDAERRFLPEKADPEAPRAHRAFTTPVLPGVRIHVLGPSRTRDIIRDMDPPKGKSFLRMQGAVSSNGAKPPAPFPNETPLPGNPVAAYMSPEDEKAVERAGSLEDLAVAVALDKAVNGTSLMIILEIGGAYLLFPGDAQWGTWAAAMDDPEWRDMLSRIAFYKVGHHGSHNATPVDFVHDMMPNEITAMVSTRTRSMWPDIPRIPLLDGLVEKHVHVVRSDMLPQAVAPFRVARNGAEVSIDL